MKRSSGVLRTASLLALLIGAVGSISLLFHASQHPPLFLLVLFVIWVLGPFVALSVADRISKRWSNLTRKNLKRRNIPVEYVFFPDEGHGWRKTPNRIRSTVRIVGWFEKYLKG